MTSQILLRRMRDLPSFEMAADSPDVRGWPVRGGDGRTFGTVQELFVDPVGRQVLYLDVVLESGLPNMLPAQPHTNQQILLPVAAVHIDADGKSVFITALRRDNIANYPLFLDFMLPPELDAAMQKALREPAQ